MNITGTLIEIYETQQVSEKFKKREFVIQDNENPQYPQYIKFELAQDKCELIDNLKIGSDVLVEFNVRGRQYTNPQGVKSTYNTLQCWKIKEVNLNGEHGPVKEKTIGEKREALAGVGEDSDLPF